jgi:type 1 fimbria pilin
MKSGLNCIYRFVGRVSHKRRALAAVVAAALLAHGQLALAQSRANATDGGTTNTLVNHKPAVRAQGGGGTITFRGAIVEPTCALPSLEVATSLPTGSASLTCARVGVSPAKYTIHVQSLATDPLPGDRLLSYLATYLGTSQPATSGAVLVTQTYE